ncbi:MobC family plasmid mobilization relaxosome protein [Streptomyces sp. NPDC088194]|uniref:MobC family plasmid mobilization relaxosome protein n=1 Tax=Streptomyces sp. NPDC088194 TaxID=3154931 RepID=UPI0034509411
MASADGLAQRHPERAVGLVGGSGLAAAFLHLLVEALQVLGFQLDEPVGAQPGYEVDANGDLVAGNGVLGDADRRDVQVLRALSRIGNNVNQITRALNSDLRQPLPDADRLIVLLERVPEPRVGSLAPVDALRDQAGVGDRTKCAFMVPGGGESPSGDGRGEGGSR